MWRQLHPKLLAERKLQVLKLRGSICRAWTPTQLEILWNPTGPEKGSGEGLLSASHANAENHPSSAGVSRSIPQTTVSSAQVGDSQSRNFPQPHCPLGNSDRNRVTVDPTALTSTKRASAGRIQWVTTMTRDRKRTQGQTLSFLPLNLNYILEEVCSEEMLRRQEHLWFHFLLGLIIWAAPASNGSWDSGLWYGSQAHAYCQGQEWSHSKTAIVNSFPTLVHFSFSALNLTESFILLREFLLRD